MAAQNSNMGCSRISLHVPLLLHMQVFLIFLITKSRMLHKHLGAYSLSSFGIFPHNQCYMEPYVSQKKRCMAFGDMEEYCLGKAIWLPAKSHQSGRISQISKCMGHCGRLNNSPLKMSTMYSLEPVNMFVLHCKRDFADVVWLRILSQKENLPVRKEDGQVARYRKQAFQTSASSFLCL